MTRLSKTRRRKRREAMERQARIGSPRRDEKTGQLSGGNPGNAGGGRKPKDFINLCRGLSYRAMQMRVRRILRKPDHPHFMQALKLASAYGWGQPKQSLEVAGKLTLEQLVAGSHKK